MRNSDISIIDPTTGGITKIKLNFFQGGGILLPTAFYCDRMGNRMAVSRF